MAGRRVRAHGLVLALSVVASLTALGVAVGTTASATASSALRYDYEFAGSTGTVSNSAPAGPALLLNLIGTWRPAADGVHFGGDTSGNRSVGFAKPANGFTLNAPATMSIGFGTRVAYTAPKARLCFGDTPNITQIGRFAAKSAQAKIQLSKCADNSTHVVIECRFAGSLTPKSVLPVRSTLPLVGGHTYDVSCIKSPDKASTATVTLAVTDLSAAQRRTVTNVFNVRAVGALKTSQALSAGNKYPMQAPAKNTDQFVGDVTRVVYCEGTSADVTSCLRTFLPLQ
jgi:hypothetical protein